METNNEVLAMFGIVDGSTLPDQRGVRSLPFQPHLELEAGTRHEDTERFINRLIPLWLKSYQRLPGAKKQRQFAECVRLVLLNLVRAEVRSDGLAVGIGTNKQQLDASRRYHPDFMSVDYFLKAIRLLQEQGIIRIAERGYRNDGLAQVARYALTEDAKNHLLRSAPPLTAFQVSKTGETIILKDDEEHPAKYNDTERTKSMRSTLDRINKTIAAANISSTRPLNPSLDMEDAPTTMTTQLRRIFNNGSFEQGGRFYGAWWQYTKKGFRPQITINGEATIEADYKALHASILFAKRGLRIPDDPYELVPGTKDNETLRGHAKTTFLALLNADRFGTAEPKAFDSTLHNMTAEQFRQSVLDAFPMLPGIFGSGVGLHLQRVDSDLAELVMLHFVDRDIPILPIHDSFIVAQHHRDELVQVMSNIFKQVYGQHIRVSVKGGGVG